MVASDWGLLSIKRSVLVDYSQALTFIWRHLTGVIEMSV